MPTASKRPGGTFTRTFEFDTVGLDQMPPRLRGIEQSVDGVSNYDVKTAPPANAVGVYAARPVRIEFRHRRVELVYAAFGRRLAIRLVDDRGNVDARFLNYQPQPSNDLPVGEAGWHDVVTGAVCSPGDLDWHWHFPVVKLTDVLHPARRYDASIYAVDGAVTDANDIDLQTTPVIHQFTFRTSNWSSLDDHLAAYLVRGPLDEIVSGQAPFGQIAATLGTAARVSDDVLLAATMTERLGLARREPATEPELVRVWHRTPGGEQLVGLILDGPEPLPRPLDGGLEIQTAANVPIPTVLLSGTSGTRTLVLFRDGANGLKAIAPDDLRIVVTDAWVAADGTPAGRHRHAHRRRACAPGVSGAGGSAVSLIDPNLLQLIGLGSKGDQDLPDGRHLRWIFNRLLGFPRTGFRLTRRPSLLTIDFDAPPQGTPPIRSELTRQLELGRGCAHAVPLRADRVQGRRLRLRTGRLRRIAAAET